MARISLNQKSPMNGNYVGFPYPGTERKLPSGFNQAP